MLLCTFLLATCSEAIVGIHPACIVGTSASAMAHLEHIMRPPEYEPGSYAAYRITDACIHDGVHVFHMWVWGVYEQHPHARGYGIPWDASAVVYNPDGHVPPSTGTYRILEYDLRNRHCIIDLGYEHDPPRRMNMKWRIDRLATEKMYKWQPWP